MFKIPLRYNREAEWAVRYLTYVLKCFLLRINGSMILCLFGRFHEVGIHASVKSLKTPKSLKIQETPSVQVGCETGTRSLPGLQCHLLEGPVRDLSLEPRRSAVFR